jgi:hypothetical protein
LVVLATLLALVALAGCAKEPPPGLEQSQATTDAPAAPGQAVPKGQSTEGTLVASRPLFYRYFHRHRDGDMAVYRVRGNVHKGDRFTTTYRYRAIPLVNGRRVMTLAVTRKYSGEDPLTTFYLEDETSGTTRAIGFSKDPRGGDSLRLYDPPPVTLRWDTAARPGWSTEIVYRTVRMEGTTPLKSAPLVLEKLVVRRPEDLRVRDATGTAIRYARALRFEIGASDGATRTVWFGRIGEIVAQEYRKGRQRERLELMRYVHR